MRPLHEAINSIMFQLQSILSKIINNNCDFCCLCFKTTSDAGFLSLADEVVFLEDSVGYNVKISEILSYVFADTDLENISAISSICEQCSSAVINVYRFIRECRENIQYLSKAVHNLVYNLQYVPEGVEDCRNLFVEFRPEHSLSHLYYDSISSLSNTECASKRFRLIKQAEKQPSKIKQENKVAKKAALNNSDNPRSLKCKECENVFPTATSLQNHFILVHKSKKYSCVDCDNIFSLKSLLEAHKKKAHSSLVCSECGKSFKDRNGLKVHEKSHHSLKIICTYCGRLYKNKFTFRKHLENNICQLKTRHNANEGKYTCDYCHKKYTQKMTLRVHIQYEHLNYKYHHCKWCNKKFWCQSRLNAHIVKHTKERNHICTVCDGKFVTKESLLYHTRIHTGERPYLCPHCDNRFLSASRRSAHIKTHHMDPTVVCDMCPAKFRSYYHLRKHKRIHAALENNTANDNELLTLQKVVKNNVDPPGKPHANMSSDKNEIVSVQNDANQNFKESSENETRLYFESNSVDYSEQIKSKAAVKQTEVVEQEVAESEGTGENTYQVVKGEEEVQEAEEDVTPMYVEVMEGDNTYFIKVSEHVEI